MYKHILLPSDGSKLSSKAVKQGIELARLLGSKVTAIHVIAQPQMIMDESFGMPSVVALQSQFDKAAQQRTKKILEGIQALAAGAKVPCETVSVKGSPTFEQIIKQAKKSKCDLILMASHGRRGLSSILLGSETAKVLTHSTIPVMVIR
jgi:nucleotide-binding universal stress UspA family protein